MDASWWKKHYYHVVPVDLIFDTDDKKYRLGHTMDEMTSDKK